MTYSNFLRDGGQWDLNLASKWDQLLQAMDKCFTIAFEMIFRPQIILGFSGTGNAITS